MRPKCTLYTHFPRRTRVFLFFFHFIFFVWNEILSIWTRCVIYPSPQTQTYFDWVLGATLLGVTLFIGPEAEIDSFWVIRSTRSNYTFHCCESDETSLLLVDAAHRLNFECCSILLLTISFVLSTAQLNRETIDAIPWMTEWLTPASR